MKGRVSDRIRISSTDRVWIRNTLLIAILGAAVTGAVSLAWPKSYRAQAKILPNDASSAESSLLGLATASGLGDLVSGISSGPDNPVMTYPEILSSRTTLQHVALSPYPTRHVGRIGTVMGAIGVKGNDRRALDRATRMLQDMTRIETNARSGTIQVSAVTRDSVLSAAIVQRMLDELNTFNLESRSSRERATREFVEGRLADASKELAHAEDALATFRQTNLRIGNSPQLQLDQDRLQRDVATRSDLYALLAREYEMAQIEEKRDTPTFSIVDPATPPFRKYRPLVSLNILVAFAGILGVRVLTMQLRRPAFRDWSESPRPIRVGGTQNVPQFTD